MVLLLKSSSTHVKYWIAQYFRGKEIVFTTINEIITKAIHLMLIMEKVTTYNLQRAAWLIAHAVKLNIIYNDQNILQLEVKRGYKIRFIDSISFTLMPLRNFP
jgi:hypothetical protein